MTRATKQASLIGYTRLSTDEQATEAQETGLRSAGCDIIIRERSQKQSS